MTVDRPVTAIDLFCGAGGLTLGLKRAGFHVVGAIEIDQLAVETYSLNHPEVSVWHSDIKAVDGKAMLARLGLEPGELDLVAGCPPCQGFSTLRTRQRGRSVPDQRNDLIFEYLRLVSELKPKCVMLENVPNLARDERMEEFLRQLGDMGFYCDTDAMRIVDAAKFGVPQRRRRMILMTSRFGPIAFPKPLAYSPTVASAIRNFRRPGTGSDPLHDYHVRRSPRVLEVIRNVPHDGGSRCSLPPDLRLACHERSGGFKDVYGRMAWDKVAPTITSGCFNPSRGRFLHPTEDRAITLREAALLQTFPDDYSFSPNAGRQAIASQVGNALPPTFIEHHALMLLSSLRNATW